MTTPGFRKRLQEADKLITTEWLKPKPKKEKQPPYSLLTARSKPEPVVERSPSDLRLHKIERLMARDGILCWLCHEPLGADITFEHLLALSVRGNSHLHNLVLCHKACNARLGSRSIAEKIRMRELNLKGTP